MKYKNFFSTFLACSMLIGLFRHEAFGCTTASAIAKNGHLWTANNEDGPFGIANFINVFPKSGTDKFGYYTMTYLSPQYALTAEIQGGMNEAGLTFDFNAIPCTNG